MQVYDIERHFDSDYGWKALRNPTETFRLGKGCIHHPLEVFQSCGDVALRDVVWCHGGDGLRWDSVISELFPTFMTVGFILRVAFTSMQ